MASSSTPKTLSSYLTKIARRVIWSRAHYGFPDRTIGETTSPHYINYPTVAELTNTDTAQRSKFRSYPRSSCCSASWTLCRQT